MSAPECIEEWQDLPADPAPDDLGYDPLELDFTHSGASGHFVVLPQDDSLLRKEAFVVVDTDAVCDVIDHR
jgi:hypothetical protein